MSLRFILGRAGSGKTHTCLSEIREELSKEPDGTPLIFLVPEQATFQMEKELACTPGLSGMMRAEILSFRRLAHRVLLEVGGVAKTYINDIGKKMIIKDILEKRKSKLQIFGNAARQNGFSESLASALSEMKIYGITPDVIENTLAHFQEEQSDQRQQQLAKKLQDLYTLYQDYEASLGEHYSDPDDYLGLLGMSLHKSNFIKNSVIWIDGFSGFTPQEYEVLRALLKTAKQVNLALCLECGELSQQPRPEELFFITREALAKVKKIAASDGIKEDKALCLTSEPLPRFKGASSIAWLEQHFFTRPTVTAQCGDDLKIIAAANKRVEVEGVARAILRLCRDENYSWREISVILRDVATYQDYIETIFKDYGIPFFIDSKQQVVHHPLVELIRSTLEVAESNWASEPVFRYLKTDLAPIAREDADLLENYVLEFGIRGQKWVDNAAWHYQRRYTLGEDSEQEGNNASYLEKINRARYQAISALKNFIEVAQQKPTVRVICQALYQLLAEIEAGEKLQTWSDEATEAGRPQEAREHLQVWDGVMALLDELVAVFGEQTLALEDLAKILTEGFESLHLGLIPPALDQVLVASLERSRNPGVRAAFVLGINDGVLPQRPSEGGLLNDTDREELQRIGLELAPDSKRKLFDEQFLIYIALTRSSEKLYLSYALADAEGSALAPSMVITRVKELLQGVPEKILATEPAPGDALEYLTAPNQALSYLTAKLRSYFAGINQGLAPEIDAPWWDVYNYSLSQPQIKAMLAKRAAGLFHNNKEKNLNSAFVPKLYGKPIKGSVSRFEKFAACPFAHFAAYGLKIKKRAKFQVSAPDFGQFFHAALKMIAEMIVNQGLEWGELDETAWQRLTEKAVTKLLPQIQNEILLSTARLRYFSKKLTKTLNRTMKTLVAHAKAGQFRPLALEVSFGMGGEMPPLKFQLSDGSSLEMRGRIDRIDEAKLVGIPYLRIIDYKSGNANLSIQDILMGTKLQLLTYMDVALAYGENLTKDKVKLAGILYFPVCDPIIKSKKHLQEQEIEELIIKEMKTKGFVLANQEVLQLMDKEIDGFSKLIPARIKKDGTLSTSCNTQISDERFGQLRTFLHQILQQFGERISAGEVAISPYRKKQSSSCQYCDFKPVCQFDRLLPENQYRVFQNISNQGAWSEIEKAIGEGVVQDEQ